MVVGDGLLARLFKEYSEVNDIIIFASGVSNSSEINENEFQREISLIHKYSINYQKKLFVYFSTCAFYDKYFLPTPYLNHKKRVEEFISNSFSNYIILRIPQIIGSFNKNQLLGYINHHILLKKRFVLYEIERNLIDLNYLLTVLNHILKYKLYQNCILNIAFPYNISVIEIVEIFEKIHGLNGIYETKKINGSFKIDNSKLLKVYNKLNLITPCYYEKSINFYYGQHN